MNHTARLLTDTADRFFADAWNEGPRSFDIATWNEAVAIGLPRMLLAESAGGMDASWRDVHGVFHAMGRFASSLPLVETVLAARILAQGGHPIPEGPLALSVRCTGELQQGGGRWQFRGELPGVALQESSALIVGVLGRGNGCSAIVLDPQAARDIHRGHNLAGEPRARLLFDNAESIVIDSDDGGIEKASDYAALLRCAQICGALLAALQRSVDYAGTRKQFGRPIGQFQSVRQALAVFAQEYAAADAACLAAFTAADRGSFEFEISCAKLRANEAIGVCSAIAHQVHGAIGFTRDFDLHHFTQRLLSWRTEYGNDGHWAQRLGAAVVARGAANFWPDLTARSDGA